MTTIIENVPVETLTDELVNLNRIQAYIHEYPTESGRVVLTFKQHNLGTHDPECVERRKREFLGLCIKHNNALKAAEEFRENYIEKVRSVAQTGVKRPRKTVTTTVTKTETEDWGWFVDNSAPVVPEVEGFAQMNVSISATLKARFDDYCRRTNQNKGVIVSDLLTSLLDKADSQTVFRG